MLVDADWEGIEMEYNGDTNEDVRANEELTKRIYATDEPLTDWEEFIACDYFKFGWESAMKYVKDLK